MDTRDRDADLEGSETQVCCEEISENGHAKILP
jgi:hypothetical protein